MRRIPAPLRDLARFLAPYLPIVYFVTIADLNVWIYKITLTVLLVAVLSTQVLGYEMRRASRVTAVAWGKVAEALNKIGESIR